jgi:hypothetical protein
MLVLSQVSDVGSVTLTDFCTHSICTMCAFLWADGMCDQGVQIDSYYVRVPQLLIVIKCCKNFTLMWPCIVTNFFIIEPTICTNFTNLFWHEILHVSDSSSVHHQEFIHCTLSNGICLTQVCRQLWSRTRMELQVLLESCLQSCMTYTIAECTVNKLLMIDRETVRNM